MPRLDVFDPPLCCPTGVCGPRVDPVLPRFAADLDWLRQRGVTVTRCNPAQQPQAFVAQPVVAAALAADPEHALPLILVDGHEVCRGAYPTRSQLAGWLGLPAEASPAAPGARSCGCGSSGCC